MAYLRLYLSNCKSSFGVGGLSDGWRASWTANMGWLEEVKLSNGNDLAKMPGSFHIRAFDADRGDEPLGLLHHLAAYGGSDDGVVEASPECYSVEVLLPEARLIQLLGLELQGHGPTEVSVSIPDLKYGWAPDGSVKNWELAKDQDSLPADSLTFSFPSKHNDEQADEPDDSDVVPIERGPSAEVNAIQGLNNELQKNLMWVIGLLAAIAIGLFFRSRG